MQFTDFVQVRGCRFWTAELRWLSLTVADCTYFKEWIVDYLWLLLKLSDSRIREAANNYNRRTSSSGRVTSQPTSCCFRSSTAYSENPQKIFDQSTRCYWIFEKGNKLKYDWPKSVQVSVCAIKLSPSVYSFSTGKTPYVKTINIIISSYNWVDTHWWG